MTRVVLFGLAAGSAIATVVQGHAWWLMAYGVIVGGLAYAKTRFD